MHAAPSQRQSLLVANTNRVQMVRSDSAWQPMASSFDYQPGRHTNVDLCCITGRLIATHLACNFSTAKVLLPATDPCKAHQAWNASTQSHATTHSSRKLNRPKHQYSCHAEGVCFTTLHPWQDLPGKLPRRGGFFARWLQLFGPGIVTWLYMAYTRVEC